MKYKFVGNGMGVPGLPHEITDDEAKELGVVEILKDAIANGNYVDIAGLDTPRKSGGTTRPAQVSKKEKEVSNGQ